MRKNDKVFTITVGGQPRLLFWVEERSTHDLTILVQEAAYGKNPFALGHPVLEEIAKRKISVHKTPKSPDINVITSRVLFRSGTQLSLDHYTSAMKKHSNYAIVLIVGCANLDHKRFLHRKTTYQSISLGSYEPLNFQLVYMILVSNLQSPKVSGAYQTNCIQIDFIGFRVTVLWSFLALPSFNNSVGMFLPTEKPEELHLLEDRVKEIAQLHANGIPSSECVRVFVTLRHFLREQYIGFLTDPETNRDWGHTPETLRTLKTMYETMGEFFKKGQADQTRYRQNRRRVATYLSSQNPITF